MGIAERNLKIKCEYMSGAKTKTLAAKYNLSLRSIYDIIRNKNIMWGRVCI